MDDKENRNKERTSEEYRQDAEEHIESLKQGWKVFGETGIFVIAAVVAVILIALAWFVFNNRVNGRMGAISAKYDGIEIGSSGNKGVHDDWLKKISSDITYHLPQNEEDKHDTSKGGSINWVLNDNSNMKNYFEGKLFEETGKDKRKDFAIEPGTKGNLDFFIKSNDDGNLSLDFTLEIIPFKVENTESTDNYSIVENEIVKKLLSRHIFYFLKTKTYVDGVEKTEYNWIPDGKFNISISNAEKDTEYEYSIYWVWPLNLGSVLLNQGDTFLNGQAIEFDDIDPSGQIRKSIISDMEDYPEKYFFNSLIGSSLTTDYNEVQEISSIHKNSGSDIAYNKQCFVDLSSYYNQADMEIGNSISFIEVTLRFLGKTEVENGE